MDRSGDEVPPFAGVDAVTAAAVWLTCTTAYGALIERAGLVPGAGY